MTKPASAPTLAKRAKAGDAEALRELHARTASSEADAVAATKALGTVATPEALKLLASVIVLHGNSVVRFEANNALARLVRKHAAARATLVALAAEPLALRDDQVLATLHNAIVDHAELRRDRRVIRALREAIAGEGNGDAQRVAAYALAHLDDRTSIPAIAALLERKSWRPPHMIEAAAQVLDQLQAGPTALAALRTARSKITARAAGDWPHSVRALDRIIARMTKRLEPAPKRPRRR